jgi:hypothetical protein
MHLGQLLQRDVRIGDVLRVMFTATNSSGGTYEGMFEARVLTKEYTSSDITKVTFENGEYLFGHGQYQWNLGSRGKVVSIEIMLCNYSPRQQRME